MVRLSWALPLSCARGPTQNAVCTVRGPMGCVTWTAALKTPTALTLWTQHGKPGQGQSRQYLRAQWKHMTRVLIMFHDWSIFFSPYLYFMLCPPNHLTVSAFLPAISREEQFEDYGEGEDVDFTPSSPCPEEDTRTNGFSDLGSSLPSRLVAAQYNHFLITFYFF